MAYISLLPGINSLFDLLLSFRVVVLKISLVLDSCKRLFKKQLLLPCQVVAIYCNHSRLNTNLPLFYETRYSGKLLF